MGTFPERDKEIFLEKHAGKQAARDARSGVPVKGGGAQGGIDNCLNSSLVFPTVSSWGFLSEEY